MTQTNLVPADAQLAAKRGFIRTTAQAYATAAASGISATAIQAAITGGQLELVPMLITAGVTLVSPLLAGVASYLSILSKGIPEDYAAKA